MSYLKIINSLKSFKYFEPSVRFIGGFTHISSFIVFGKCVEMAEFYCYPIEINTSPNYIAATFILSVPIIMNFGGFFLWRFENPFKTFDS
jgi:hypothetical protein